MGDARGTRNLHVDPDVYLPDRRARREVPPLHLGQTEVQQWRTGTPGKVEPRNGAHAQAVLSETAQVSLRPVPAPARQPTTRIAVASPRKRRPDQTHYVCWRNEWLETGQTPRMTPEAADRYASRFDRPRCWAVVIDAKRHVFAKEYGTRFAALPAVSLCNVPSQGVSGERKPPAREAAQLRQPRAHG
jgi:hypothetical protein